jgi:hypothetical protein
MTRGGVARMTNAQYIIYMINDVPLFVYLNG